MDSKTESEGEHHWVAAFAMINGLLAYHIVHRQPRFSFFTVKLPIMGPIVGPMTMVAAQAMVASPRVRMSQRSTKTPGTTVTVATPQAPCMNRQIMMVCKFCAQATPTVKHMKPM